MWRSSLAMKRSKSARIGTGIPSPVLGHCVGSPGRSAQTAEQAGGAYRIATRLLDRAARKRLIHPNTAARHKSRLSVAVRKLSK